MSFDYDRWLLEGLPDDSDFEDNNEENEDFLDEDDHEPQDDDCDYWKNVMAHY